jgi:hypothetical protein
VARSIVGEHTNIQSYYSRGDNNNGFNRKDLHRLLYLTPYHMGRKSSYLQLISNEKEPIVDTTRLRAQLRKKPVPRYKRYIVYRTQKNRKRDVIKAQHYNNVFTLLILGLCFLVIGVAMWIVLILTNQTQLSTSQMLILNTTLIAVFFIFIISCFATYLILQNISNPFRSSN